MPLKKNNRREKWKRSQDWSNENIIRTVWTTSHNNKIEFTFALWKNKIQTYIYTRRKKKWEDIPIFYIVYIVFMYTMNKYVNKSICVYIRKGKIEINHNRSHHIQEMF